MDVYNKTMYAEQGDVNERTLEQAAKQAHIDGKVYFVLIVDGQAPVNAIEVNKGYYRVKFLDERLRKYMSYEFFGLNGNRLFLSSITIWGFLGNTDDVTKVTDYMFKEDGTFNVIERDVITDEQTDSYSKSPIDVTGHYEECPEFGDYRSMIRKER